MVPGVFLSLLIRRPTRIKIRQSRSSSIGRLTRIKNSAVKINMARNATNFQVQLPDAFSFSTPNDWPRWSRRFERFRIASGLNKKSGEEQVNALIYSMGDQADDILLSLKLDEDDLKDYEKVLKGFENHFIPRRNIVFERAKFHKKKFKKMVNPLKTS
jgi:hypothetical protein